VGFLLSRLHEFSVGPIINLTGLGGGGGINVEGKGKVREGKPRINGKLIFSIGGPSGFETVFPTPQRKKGGERS